jgi:hypothetical protein
VTGYDRLPTRQRLCSRCVVRLLKIEATRPPLLGITETPMSATCLGLVALHEPVYALPCHARRCL